MKLKVFFLLFITFTSTQAQSWQWAKRGGGMTASNNFYGKESVEQILTDTNNNVYVISRVYNVELDVDGIDKPYYGNPQYAENDYVVASFACDGTYRWSKIFGGNADDNLRMTMDGQNNIYLTGRFGSCNVDYPPTIEGDMVIPQTAQAPDCRLFFLAKYNSNGVMQWFKRPELPTNYPNETFYYQGLEADSAGNTYWCVYLRGSNYANGYVNPDTTVSNQYRPVVFKYDTQGNFVSGTPMDMVLSPDFAFNLRFYRNPQNGNYYFTSNGVFLSTTNVATLGGTTITGSFFIASYNPAGQKLWHQQDAANAYASTFQSYDLAFDSDNNVYFSGFMNGGNLATFMGFTRTAINPGQYVVKLNATGTNLLWASSAEGASDFPGCSVAVHGTEVVYGGHCGGQNYTWDSQSINVNANEGFDPLMARFNKDTGTCTSLVHLPGDVGYQDAAVAVAVDSSGDYLIGGSLGHYLYTGTGSILNVAGIETDFFVAKYAALPCSLATENNENTEAFKVYPNPAHDQLNIETQESITYQISNLLGAKLQSGTLNTGTNTIQIDQLATGYYVLTATNSNGKVFSKKIVKE